MSGQGHGRERDHLASRMREEVTEHQPRTRLPLLGEIRGKTVLVTGASGFVGSRLIAFLHELGGTIRGVSRGKVAVPAWLDHHALNLPLSHEQELDGALCGCDAIVHLAGLAHSDGGRGSKGADLFQKINVNGSLQLAERAAALGVRRFVFVSSIKVCGEKTAGTPFGAQDEPCPHGPYARSKYAAEQGLREIAARTGIELVIIRPPLVYGGGEKGNLARLRRWISLGIPLPFASIANRRDLISIENLCEILALCLVHPAAAGELFLVADGTPFSTPELVRFLARQAGCRPRLFPCPVGLLRLLGSLLGRSPLADRLCDSLEVDCNRTATLLGWRGRIPRI